jgi:hypothetical protein
MVRRKELTTTRQTGGLLDQPVVAQVVMVWNLFYFSTPTEFSKLLDDTRNSQTGCGICEIDILRGFPVPPSILQLFGSTFSLRRCPYFQRLRYLSKIIARPDTI